MATSKRQRQKAARREKIEQMQRAAKRRKNIRRAVIVTIVAVLVVGTGALLFTGKSTPPTTTSTTTTAPVSTTTVVPTTIAVPKSIAPVGDPSPAGTFGKAPTLVVPPGAAPTVLESTDLIKGTGAVVKQGSTFTAQYVLATYSSRKVVQSSWTSQAFSDTLLPANLIPGWVEGMVGMRAGGRRELIIPPSLGYGATSPGTGIAKNDTLVFIIDLLKVGS